MGGSGFLRPKIGLALGSGGLRGTAHIGVLKVLERETIPIDYIAGCSIGSMIAALYCSGYTPEQILNLAKKIKPSFWMDFIVPKMGILAGDRFLETMRILTRKNQFSDLSIPLAVVATEITSGCEVVFTEGDVAPAVRASISVPGIFVPFRIGEMLLVDGAVLNPTPLNVLEEMGAEIIIGVDLAHAGIVNSITNVFDVILQSIDIMERELFNHRQQRWDIIIRPNVAHIPPSSFEYIDEGVRLGEVAAEESLPQIKYTISKLMNIKGMEAKIPSPQPPS